MHHSIALNHDCRTPSVARTDACCVAPKHFALAYEATRTTISKHLAHTLCMLNSRQMSDHPIAGVTLGAHATLTGTLIANFKGRLKCVPHVFGKRTTVQHGQAMRLSSAIRGAVRTPEVVPAAPSGTQVNRWMEPAAWGSAPDLQAATTSRNERNISGRSCSS